MTLLLMVNTLSIYATIFIFKTQSGSTIMKIDDVLKTVQYGSGDYNILNMKKTNGVLTLDCDKSTRFECIVNSSGTTTIKEYQNIATNSVKLFHWDGYGDYAVKDIESTYARNLNNYIAILGVNQVDAQKVKNESYRILQAIMSGTINHRDVNGRFTVPAGYESTGINERKSKGFLKRKDYVRDADFYRNLGYNIIDKTLRDTPIYYSSAVPKKWTLINTWNITNVETIGETNDAIQSQNLNNKIDNLGVEFFNKSKSYLAKGDFIHARIYLKEAITHGITADILKGMLELSVNQMANTKRETHAQECVLYTTVLLETTTWPLSEKEYLYFIRGLSKMLLGDASCEDDLRLGGEKGKEVLDSMNSNYNQGTNRKEKSRSLIKDPNFKIK